MRTSVGDLAREGRTKSDIRELFESFLVVRRASQGFREQDEDAVLDTLRNFVLFETDLFLYRQRDEDIDQWFVGGDCAGWFYARLLPLDHIRPGSEPVMEDWGWTFTVSVDDVRVRVNVWAFYQFDNCWLLGIEAKQRLFRRYPPETLQRVKEVVCEALHTILAQDPRLLKRKWFAESPFDHNGDTNPAVRPAE